MSVVSPYYFIRSRQDIRRNRHTDLLGGFEIDYELEFYWLLYRKISRLGTFEDFVNVGGGTPVEVDGTHSVRYETARVAKLYFRVHRGQFVFRSQSYDLTWVGVVKGIPLYQECVRVLLDRNFEGSFKTSDLPNIQGLNLHAQGARGNLNFFQRRYVTRVRSIEKDRDARSFNDRLFEQLQAFSV